MMSYKCELCGTYETGTEKYSVSFEFDGGKSLGNISCDEKRLCTRCACRFFPMFKNLAQELTPICNNPWDLVEENVKLKNVIHELENKLQIAKGGSKK